MDLDKICYKNTPIKRVIFKLDFLESIKELNDSLPSTVIDLIKKSFPVAEPKDVIANELRISNSGVQQEKSSGKQWTFHTVERNASLVIEDNFFAIEVHNYISFQKIFEVLREIIDLFFTHFDKAICRRMGLRYVNEIDINEKDPLDWNEYINPDLISILNNFPNKEKIVRAFHNLELKEEEIHLKFQYGIMNPDYPALIKKKVFILDLDASYHGILHHREIEDYLRKQHLAIQKQFEYSITEKLRDKFGLNSAQL